MSDPKSDPKKDPSLERWSDTHRDLDLDLSAIRWSAWGLTAIIVVTFVIVGWLYAEFRDAEIAQDPVPDPLVELDRLPPEPRLQTNPDAELAAMRAEEEATLGTYGWIDENDGRVRIPIQRAMELTVMGRNTLLEPELPQRTTETP